MLQKAMWQAVKFNDVNRIKDFGGDIEIDLNFMIEIESKVFYPLIIIAAVRGYIEVLELLVKNPAIDLNMVDPQ